MEAYSLRLDPTARRNQSLMDELERYAPEEIRIDDTQQKEPPHGT